GRRCRKGERESDKRDAPGYTMLLARQGGSNGGGESGRQWRKDGRNQALTPAQSQPAHSKPQKAGADPKAQRCKEGFVVYGGLGHALRGHDDLIAGLCHRPECDCANDQKSKVRIKALPKRGRGPADLCARCGYGRSCCILPCRNEKGRYAEEHSDGA